MNPLLKYSSPLLASILSLTGVCHASDDFAENDIAVCFYQVTMISGNPVVGNNTYIVNLGPGALFRENTQNNVPVKTISPGIAESNIKADLDATFGDDWADSDSVYWFVIGGNSSTSQLTNGDPARTNYYSRSRTSFQNGALGAGSTISNLNSGNMGLLTNSVTPMLKGTSAGANYAISNGIATSGLNTSGVVIPISANVTVDEQLPPASPTIYFQTGIDPRQKLAAGPLAGGAGLEGALDIYRFLYNTTGADLTAGASSGNAVAGNGQFIGTLTLDAAGNLKIQGVGTPTAGNYTSWATTNNVTGGASGDSDHDGISNLVEYALALNPAKSDGAPGSFSNDVVIFTKRAEAVTNNDVVYAIQESSDLGISDPWHTVTPTTNSPSIISYVIPSGSARKFVRLVVTKAP